MPLFKVELSQIVVIEADDEDDAYGQTLYCRSEIIGDSDPDIYVDCEIRAMSQLPTGWDDMCLPYGGDGSTRIKDLISTEEKP